MFVDLGYVVGSGWCCHWLFLNNRFWERLSRFPVDRYFWKGWRNHQLGILAWFCLRFFIFVDFLSKSKPGFLLGVYFEVYLKASNESTSLQLLKEPPDFQRPPNRKNSGNLGFSQNGQKKSLAGIADSSFDVVAGRKPEQKTVCFQPFNPLPVKPLGSRAKLCWRPPFCWETLRRPWCWRDSYSSG